MNLAKILIFLGSLLILAGVVVWISSKIPGLNRLGRLPGDFRYEGKNTTFYFPLATSILISLLLSFLFWIFRGGRL